MRKKLHANGIWKMEPFSAIPVLAAIDATPEEQAVLSALHFLYMWLGDVPVGIEAIVAVLINPDQPPRVKAGTGETKEELGQITESGIKRALARMKARGWVEGEKGFGGKTSYRITVPVMTNAEGQKIVKARMSEKLRLYFFPKEAPDSTPDLFSAPAVKSPPSDPPSPLAPGGDTPASIRKRDQDEIWAHWKAGYIAKYSQQPVWPAFKWVGPAIAALVAQIGVAEIKRRMTNMLEDPYTTSASFADFLARPDKWVAKREPFQKGGGSARPFNTPKTDWKPSAAPGPA